MCLSLDVMHCGGNLRLVLLILAVLLSTLLLTAPEAKIGLMGSMDTMVVMAVPYCKNMGNK